MKITRKIVAAVILNKKGEVLLCRRAASDDTYPGVWHMPGGGIENEETIEACMKRELMEELNVSVVDVGDDIKVSEKYVVNNGLHHVDFYPVKVSGEIKLNPENDQYNWVAIEKFDDYLGDRIFQINKNAMQKALAIRFFSDI